MVNSVKIFEVILLISLGVLHIVFSFVVSENIFCSWLQWSPPPWILLSCFSSPNKLFNIRLLQKSLCPGPYYSNFSPTRSLHFETYFSILAHLLSSRTTDPPAYSTLPFVGYLIGITNSTGPKFTLPLSLHNLAFLLILTSSINEITLKLGGHLRNLRPLLTQIPLEYFRLKFTRAGITSLFSFYCWVDIHCLNILQILRYCITLFVTFPKNLCHPNHIC